MDPPIELKLNKKKERAMMNEVSPSPMSQNPSEKPYSHIITAQTASDVFQYISRIKQKILIILDVDDTLITPQSHLFRPQSPYFDLITDLKKNHAYYPQFEIMLSHWRLTRKVQLVDEKWPDTIEKLKKDHIVLALTKMDTGPLGDIPSMEEWRYNELLSFNLQLSSVPDIQDELCTMYKGIMMTGPLKKSETFLRLGKVLDFDHMIFVDDRTEYINDMALLCQRMDKAFTGILFEGTKHLP